MKIFILTPNDDTVCHPCWGYSNFVGTAIVCADNKSEAFMIAHSEFSEAVQRINGKIPSGPWTDTKNIVLCEEIKHSKYSNKKKGLLEKIPLQHNQATSFL